MIISVLAPLSHDIPSDTGFVPNLLTALIVFGLNLACMVTVLLILSKRKLLKLIFKLLSNDEMVHKLGSEKLKDSTLKTIDLFEVFLSDINSGKSVEISGVLDVTSGVLVGVGPGKASPGVLIAGIPVSVNV